MAYQISLSRKQLELQLDELAKKLREAERPAVSVPLREFAIAAAIFLAHAEFENYFVDVLSRLAGMYSHAAANAAELPPRLRAHLVLTQLNVEGLAGKIASRSGEPDILALVEGWFASPASALLNDSRALVPFDGRAIHGDYDYPSTKNIVRVLRRIGVGDPKGALNGTVGRDVIALLESLAALRTSLAHTATLPGIGPADVRSRIAGLKVFVRAMDRVLYSHTCRFFAHSSWRTGMC